MVDYGPLSEIQEGMARAFFVSAYADQYDECPNPPFNAQGVEWMDAAPDETDPAAIHAAVNLTHGLARLNSGRTPEDLFALAQAIQESDLYRHGPQYLQGDRELTHDMFGHYLAMQAMGHGVGLGDAFGQLVRDAIKVPYVEFGGYSLERDYFPSESTAEDEQA